MRIVDVVAVDDGELCRLIVLVVEIEVDVDSDDAGDGCRLGVRPTVGKHEKQNLLFMSFVAFTSGTPQMAWICLRHFGHLCCGSAKVFK